jgi:hypothetical protein
MAQEGFEPSASLILSESGLPVAYRAKVENIAVPGAGIEPAASTFRAWRHDQPQLPRSLAFNQFGKEASNLHRPVQSRGAYQLADSRVVVPGEHHARIELACPVWKTGAFAARPMVRSAPVEREAEGEGVEPPKLALVRFRDGRRHQSACPSVESERESTGGRNRTCELLINIEARVPAHATPVEVGRGKKKKKKDEEQRNMSRGGRDRTDDLLLPRQADSRFPTPRNEKKGLQPDKCPAGVEPARPPWQGGRLPLHHGHTCQRRIVKEFENGTRGARTLTHLVKSQGLCR